MKIYLKIIVIVLSILTYSTLLADDQLQEESVEISIPDYSLSIASQNQGMLQNQIYAQSNQSTETRVKKHPLYKSETLAFAFGFFPGFFMHGLGHGYAGDIKTAAVLFGLEAISILALASGEEIIVLSHYDKKEEPSYKTVLTIVGIVTFLGSWVWDFAHAPTAAKNYNDRIRTNIMFSSDQYNDIKVSLAFSF